MAPLNPIKIIMISLLCWCSLMLSCMNNVVDGGTETGNAVIGTLRNANGSPAKHAKVKFITYNHQPGEKRVSIYTIVDSTTTDTNGVYRFNIMAADTYNIFGEDSAGNLSYQDSVIIAGDTTNPDTVPPDTLKIPGSIAGYIKMESGDDPRTVTMYIIGATKYALPETDAYFNLAEMAEGTYRVRILSTLDKYSPLDTKFTITAGVDLVLTDSIVVPLKIPKITGFTLEYDTLKQIVYLSWDKADTSKVKGYNVYRHHVDSTDVKLNVQALTDTFYVDSTGFQDETYIYSVVGVDLNSDEGIKVSGDSITIWGAFALIDSLDVSRIDNPFGIKVAQNGDIYVMDYNQENLLVFDSLYTFVKEISCSTLVEPRYFDFDSLGNIYAADQIGVFKYDTSGAFADTVLTWNHIDSKYITVAGNNIFVSNRNVRKYLLDGTLVWEDSAGSAARGLSFSNQQLYICDANTGTIRILDLDGNEVDEWDLGFDSPTSPRLLVKDTQSIFYATIVNLPASATSQYAIYLYNSDRSFRGAIYLEDTPKGIEIIGNNLLVSLGSQVRIYLLRS